MNFKAGTGGAGTGTGARGPGAVGAAPSARHVPVSVIIALIRAAIQSGADIRGALQLVADAVTTGDLPEDGPQDADCLGVVARRLAIGLSWEAAWADVPERFAMLERSLGQAWTYGASPVGPLAAAQRSQVLASRRAGAKAAARLATRLTLPLTLCLLPAFVLLAIVPLLVALASGILAGL